MRKKKLVQEFNGIVARNNELYSKCRKLEISVNEKDTLIDSLKLSIEELKAENEILKSDYFSKIISNKVKDDVEIEDFADVKETSQIEENEDVEDIVDDAEVENIADVKEMNEPENIYSQSTSVPEVFDCDETVNSKTEFKPILNESALKLSSSTIGRVVLKCAEICNVFVSENNINSKDLINLALGKTEVFKAEVLELLSQDISDEILTEELKTKENEIFEYFELLLRQ